MNQLCRQTIVAAALAVLGSVSSSAWAESYTIDFKTLFNTATTENAFDTKTLNYSVAKLTISDLAGGNGVQLSLQQNSHLFPALTPAGNFVDALWIKGGSGALSSVSGAPLAVGAGYSATPFVKDTGYAYTWNVDFNADSFAEGQSAVLTLTGAGLSANTFAAISQTTPIMLKRGITVNDDLWAWHNAFVLGRGKRRDGLIVLQNDQRQPVKVWAFHRGIPTKYSGPVLSASDSQVALEQLEITHEGLALISPVQSLSSIVGAVSSAAGAIGSLFD